MIPKVNGHEVIEFRTHYRKITQDGYYDFKNIGYSIKRTGTADVTIDDDYTMSQNEVIAPGLSIPNGFFIDRKKIKFGATGTKELQVVEILPYDEELAHYVEQKTAR